LLNIDEREIEYGICSFDTLESALAEQGKCLCGQGAVRTLGINLLNEAMA